MARILLLALTLSVAAPAWAAEPVKPLAITIGATVPLQMSDKQPIVQYFVSNANVVRVQPHPQDRTTLLVTGLQIGRVRITLIGADGKRETR